MRIEFAGPFISRPKVSAVALAAAVLIGLSASPTLAESLRSALEAAYLNNPTLRAERAGLRATDEDVSQARAGWRPTVTATGDVGTERTRTTPASVTPANPGGANTTTPAGVSIALNQPIFRGFRTVSREKQAIATVEAGRAGLLGVEQSVLLLTVTAYMDVIRDRQIVELRRQNIEVLREQLRAAQARFEVGEVTRTDVAQAQSRLAEAISNLSEAQAQLAASAAAYNRVVGRSPGTLQFPPRINSILPGNMDQAIAQGEQRNPEVLAAMHVEEASRYGIDVEKGSLFPEVSLQLRYSWRSEPSASIDETETGSIVGQVTVPLYQSGAEYARIRQAQNINNQRRIQIIEARRAARETVVQAWTLLEAARETIQSATEQVSAAELAFEGVQQEAEVGTRTTLDVLDAEQELLNARVLLVTAQRDEIVRSYQLLSAIGRLTARDLELSVPLYDPTEHFERVRRKPFGFDLTSDD